MIAIKLIARQSVNDPGKCALFYEIRVNRELFQVSVPYLIPSDDWDFENQTFALPLGACTSYLHDIRHRIREEMSSITDALSRLSYGDSVPDIIFNVLPYDSVFRFFRRLSKQMEGYCRYGTHRTYQSTLNRFMLFRCGEDLHFPRIDSRMIEDFEAFLRSKHNVRNTVSFYLRTFRTMYRKAIASGLCESEASFKNVYTGFDRTRKRAVSLEWIRTISRIKLTASSLCFARDMFMFSFYMRGMPFVDMAYLKKTDLKGGFICYRRRKTGSMLVIQWERQMQAIVQRYSSLTGDSPYLLPILISGRDDYSSYRIVERCVNRNLKRIGEMIGLNVPLTTYVARHSWASVARNMQIPVSVISEGLGHDSERTTQVYLSSLDVSVVSDANRRILQSL